jgi:hypothetical protein
MRKYFWLVFCLLWVPVVRAGVVRDTVFSGKPVVINCQTGRVSEVDFPEDIAKPVKAVPSTVCQFEIRGEKLFILPFQNGSIDFFVITKNGTSYPLSINITREGGWDTRVTVDRAQERVNAEGRGNFTIQFLKLLLQDKDPSGSSRLEGSVEVYKSESLTLTLKTLIEIADTKGFILEATNVTDRPVVFPVQDISYPKLLAICAEKQVIEPKSTIKVYMVVGS